MDSLTTEEILQYITLNTVTPESVRFVARVNALMAEDEGLRRRIEALEEIYDSLTLPPEDLLPYLLEQEEGQEQNQYQH